ncbi:c-type cytochrome [Candidatus Pelagibacter bacterium nBUS_30]|uniref:c-type cytochrome n=1 Tax=unclassified Candidatus Pelagibacter TaxID=2647897 RepID=UPI003EBBAC8F
MHSPIKHIANNIGTCLFIIILVLLASNANSEQSAEDTIKARKALFSKNYKTAKRVQSLSANGEFDEAKELMIEMSKNYEVLLGLFPENSKEGFKTGALPTIWQDKENFNTLMKKSSVDMIKLTSLIETTDDIKGTVGKLMWGNCKACHSKYRKEH